MSAPVVDPSTAASYLAAALQPPPLPATPRKVERIAVIGSGTMGVGIALACAQGGYTVSLHDTNPQALEQGLTRLRTLVESSVQKGRVSAEAGAQILARVSAARELSELATVDLAIEAVFENLAIKQQLMQRLGALTHPEAVLATNTSTLDIDAIAAASGRAPQVLGMHFFSPAHVMRLVEVVRGRESTPQALATVLATTRAIGKIGVLVGNGFGFVGNRMLYAYGREKELMLLEGAGVEQLDAALESFGMAMGPNAVGDLAGLDIGAQARRAWKDRPDDPRYYRVTDLLVEQGRLGQKSGRGFYRYPAGSRKREPDPEVEALIEAEAARLRITRRALTDEEIVQRCMAALINEGARILEASLVPRASDIDLIWCHAYGFPSARGGPMFYADTVGLPVLLEQMRDYRDRYGARYWTASPLLERLAQAGKRVSSYDSTAPAS